MNKLDALIEAAKAAAVIDHNEQEGWYSEECIREQGAHYPKNARFIAACDPTTILELCALLEKVEEAMLSVLCDPEGVPCFEGSDGDRVVIDDALAAIKQWKEQQVWSVHIATKRFRRNTFALTQEYVLATQ